MTARRLEKTDLTALAALYAQFWDEAMDEAVMRRQWEILEAGGRHILLAAEDGGRLVGSVMGVVCEELYGDGRPFLVVENLIVDKGERRKGAGRMLLRELEKAASARNCAQMILVTEEERADARGFYEAYGFDRRHRGDKKTIARGDV